MPKPRAAIYCRVSDRKQVDRYSLGTQEKMLRDYADQHGLDIAGVFIERGKSAKSLDRPELQRCLAGISAGHFDILLVLESDRLTRSVPDLYALMALLQKANCRLIPILEPATDFNTPDGELMATIRTATGQHERKHIAQRVKRNMIARSKSGAWNGGKPPFGYMVQRRYENMLKASGKSDSEAQQEAAARFPERGKLYVFEEEADILKELFRIFLAENSLRKTATTLNHAGKFTRRGRAWDGSTVRQVLVNPVYIGVTQWEEVKSAGQHEALIDRETFERVQRALVNPKHKPTRGSRTYLLSGLVFCGLCGARYYAHTSRKPAREHAYYLCSNRTKRRTCTGMSWPADLLESLVIGELRRLSENRAFLQDRERLLSAIAERMHGKPHDTGDLDRQIVQTQAKMEALLDAMLNQGFNDEIARGKYEALGRELDNLQRAHDRERRRLDRARAEFDAMSLSLDRMEEFGNFWDTIEPGDRVEYLRSIIDRVVVVERTAELYLLTDSFDMYDSVGRSQQSQNSLKPLYLKNL